MQKSIFIALGVENPDTHFGGDACTFSVSNGEVFPLRILRFYK